jgi:Zn-dependent protease
VSISPIRQSVRPSPIFLAIVAVTALGGALAWVAAESTGLLAHAGVFIFVIAGWLVSLSLHEFGHAFTAWRFGDRDVELRGYLTLNPLKYSNPLLSLGLPLVFIALGGIGLPGGAVYLRTWSMTKRQRTVVSLAGPLANVVLAVILLAVTAVFWDTTHLAFWGALAFLGFLQVTAVILNLLPIPGLDGYNALEPHLSYDTQRALNGFKQYGFLILLILLIAPPLNQWFFSIVYWLVELSGVPAGLSGFGGQLTRFWSAW